MGCTAWSLVARDGSRARPTAPRYARPMSRVALASVPAPEVSVLIPVRDAEDTIDEALESVLDSRGVALEVVCVDDGSQDATARRLADWQSREPTRLRVLRRPAAGIVAALDAGLVQCRAPLVARMDADDVMHRDRLRLQRALLAARPDLWLVGCLVESFRSDADGGLRDGYRLYTAWANQLVDPDDIEREAFVECPIPHPTWMFHATRIRALEGYRDAPFPEDLDLLYRVLRAGGRLGKVPAVLHRWRDHPRRLSRTDARYGRDAFTRVKAEHVARLHPMRGAVVWGTGPTARRLVRALANNDVATHALIDVAPALVGRRWHDIPIYGVDSLPRQLPAWRAAGLRILGAVSSRGARSQIREQLDQLRLVEGEDFVMLA